MSTYENGQGATGVLAAARAAEAAAKQAAVTEKPVKRVVQPTAAAPVKEQKRRATTLDKPSRVNTLPVQEKDYKDLVDTWFLADAYRTKTRSNRKHVSLKMVVPVARDLLQYIPQSHPLWRALADAIDKQV